MQVKQVMEEVVEPRPTHTFHVGVLVAPSKRLLANDRVHLVQLRNIWVIDVLAVLNKSLIMKIIISIVNLVLMVEEVKAIYSNVPGPEKSCDGVDVENNRILRKRTKVAHAVIQDIPKF